MDFDELAAIIQEFFGVPGQTRFQAGPIDTNIGASSTGPAVNPPDLPSDFHAMIAAYTSDFGTQPGESYSDGVLDIAGSGFQPTVGDCVNGGGVEGTPDLDFETWFQEDTAYHSLPGFVDPVNAMVDENPSTQQLAFDHVYHGRQYPYLSSSPGDQRRAETSASFQI